MKVLVINAGSSSLKAQLIDTVSGKVYAKCGCERIGIGNSFIKFESDKGKVTKEIEMKEHGAAIKCLISYLLSEDYGCIASLNEIDAIGHRMVHGGEKYIKPCLVTQRDIDKFEEIIPLAPLHNPAHILGMRACLEAMPDKKNVVVFDTGFHATIPKKAYMYAIPYEFYEKNKIRRYGAHGTSHRYVSEVLSKMVGGLEGKKIISCHLGNGSSVTAIKDGKSIDTSMGYTPLAGVVMGTRSGDVDPSVLQAICNIKHIDVNECLTILNKKSGMFGINGESSDMRDIDANLEKPLFKLSYDMLCYSIKKYIGAYAAIMNGVDYIIFTGGIGENDASVREEVLRDMTYMGAEIDTEKNKNLPRGTIENLSSKSSKVQIFRIPTDEELVIARDTERLVKR